MAKAQTSVYQAMVAQTTEGTQLAQIFTDTPEVLTDLVRGARLPWKQVARALKGVFEAMLTLEHALALAAIPPMPKSAAAKSAAAPVLVAPPFRAQTGVRGRPCGRLTCLWSRCQLWLRHLRRRRLWCRRR